MTSFLLWTHFHRDLIIFAAIALSSFAGYWTHADIVKASDKAKVALLRELAEPHLETWQGRTGTIYCKEDNEPYPCPTALKINEVLK